MSLPSAIETIIDWSTDSIPTSTTLSSIETTYASGLLSTLSSATQALATETNRASLVDLAHMVRGAQASLSIISAEKVIATATAQSVLAEATSVIFNSTLNLNALEKSENLYSGPLNLGANTFLTVIFGIALVTHLGMTGWSRYIYFGLSFVFGTGLEFAGYLARALAANDLTNINYFLCQIICLTIAPAFVMAGVYYLLAQLIVYHGRQYSILKPTWFTYVFVFCDITSLVIQAIGGGMAAVALNQDNPTGTGTHIMVAGIAFQVFSMTLFLVFSTDFMRRVYFKSNAEIKFSFHNLFSLFFNTKRGEELRIGMDSQFNPKFVNVRRQKLFPYAPLAMLLAVIFIYIRCIYRLVELSQGWTGYLITHEAFVMTLDAMMVLFTSYLLLVFHPAFMYGKEGKLSLDEIRKRKDLEFEDDDQNLLGKESEEEPIYNED